MEYETKYTKKYDEDLNTTLAFVHFRLLFVAMQHHHIQAGFFFAVSSAFVVEVRSKLEPDSGERSEAYVRAPLLGLNQSIAPDEHPAVPPSWNAPPTEIIPALDLLYASLLMYLLLVAFVVMWANSG